MDLSKLMLPTAFKGIGWVLFIPSALLGIAAFHFQLELDFLSYSGPSYMNNNFTNELALSGVLLGLWMMSFSKKKQEDEWLQRLRLESFIIGFQISLALFFVANLALYGESFFFILVYNCLTPLLLFNIVFGLKLRAANKDLEEETA